MVVKAENFSELNRKNMEAAMRLAQMSIENSQRVMSLQNELARELFNDGVQNARAQSGAKDPQEVMRLRAEYAQETAKKMMTVAQQVAEIGNDSRQTFSRLLTEQLASGSQDMADAFQGFFKSMPGHNPNMMEIMQQAMINANAAFEQIAQATTATFTGMTDTAMKKPAPKKK